MFDTTIAYTDEKGNVIAVNKNPKFIPNKGDNVSFYDYGQEDQAHYEVVFRSYVEKGAKSFDGNFLKTEQDNICIALKRI